MPDAVDPDAAVETPEQLVVWGRFGWLAPTLGAAGVGLVASAVTGILVANAAKPPFPWMPDVDELTGHILETEPLLPWLLVSFAAIFSALVAREFFVRRAGCVELLESEIVFSWRGLRRRTVPWTDVAAYSDHSPAYVDLLRRSDRYGKPGLAIPVESDHGRATVLALLDARGVPRVEPRTTRAGLYWAFAIAFSVVLAFAGGVYVANSSSRGWERLLAGKLSRAEADQLLEDTLTTRVRIRPVVGAEDGLAVLLGVRLGRSGSFVSVAPAIDLEYDDVRFFIDGRLVLERNDPRETVACLGDSFPERLVGEIANLGTAPGRHRLDVAVAFHVHTWARSLANCQKSATTSFEVVPGSIASQVIKSLPSSSQALEVWGSDTAAGPSIRIGWDDLPVRRAFLGCVTVREGTAEIASASLRLGGQTAVDGSRRHWVFLPRLAKGNHALKVRFASDPKVAFAADVDLDEIGNYSFEREVTLDVK